MKNKVSKPRTIADLKFNWEFINYPMGYPSIEIARELVSKKNPDLNGFKIVPNKYSIFVNDKTVILDTDFGMTVLDFFEWVCFRMQIHFPPTIGHFSHFERIDDQTYRIRMKS